VARSRVTANNNDNNHSSNGISMDDLPPFLRNAFMNSINNSNNGPSTGGRTNLSQGNGVRVMGGTIDDPDEQEAIMSAIMNGFAGVPGGPPSMGFGAFMGGTGRGSGRGEGFFFGGFGPGPGVFHVAQRSNRNDDSSTDSDLPPLIGGEDDADNNNDEGSDDDMPPLVGRNGVPAETNRDRNTSDAPQVPQPRRRDARSSGSDSSSDDDSDNPPPLLPRRRNADSNSSSSGDDSNDDGPPPPLAQHPSTIVGPGPRTNRPNNRDIDSTHTFFAMRRFRGPETNNEDTDSDEEQFEHLEEVD